MMISNVVWAVPSNRNRKLGLTVSEKVDVYIRLTKNEDKKRNVTREYLTIRFFGAKFEAMFKDASFLRFGCFGDYAVFEEVSDASGYTVYKNSVNPEIRIPIDDVLAMDRDPETLIGSWLIKFDRNANQAYVDLTRKAIA